MLSHRVRSARNEYEDAKPEWFDMAAAGTVILLGVLFVLKVLGLF